MVHLATILLCSLCSTRQKCSTKTWPTDPLVLAYTNMPQKTWKISSSCRNLRPQRIRSGVGNIHIANFSTSCCWASITTLQNWAVIITRPKTPTKFRSVLWLQANENSYQDAQKQLTVTARFDTQIIDFWKQTLLYRNSNLNSIWA